MSALHVAVVLSFELPQLVNLQVSVAVAPGVSSQLIETVRLPLGLARLPLVGVQRIEQLAKPLGMLTEYPVEIVGHTVPLIEGFESGVIVCAFISKRTEHIKHSKVNLTFK